MEGWSETMSFIKTLASPVVLAIVLASGATNGALAANRSGLHHPKAHLHSYRPPLKFAAGACVRRCPAGYRDTGRYCRFRNMNR